VSKSFDRVARSFKSNNSKNPMNGIKQLYPTVVQTKRFTLSPLSAAHAEQMFEGLSDERAYRFIPDMPPASAGALAERYTRLEGQMSPDGQEVWLNWVIGSTRDATLYGYVQFTIRLAERRASVAYFVFPRYQRQGIASETVAAALSSVASTFHVTQIDAEIDTRNAASIALVESLGFVRTCLVEHADEFKGAVSDEYHYAFHVPGNDPVAMAKTAPQNIYDDTTFFEGYKALRDSDTGLNGALEIPALQRLLPDLTDLHVLDLGCGFGEFARFARWKGAASVTGVDISRRMLDEAIKRTSDTAVSYVHAPIEQYLPKPKSFDLVVSSLALHYVDDYAALVARVFQSLKPGGRFLFSVEHPICTAYPAGWLRDEAGHKRHWPVDRYQTEGKRDTRWFVDGVVKYHRTVDTYVNTLIQRGFVLEHLGEPVPTDEALALRPALEDDCRRPPFLFLKASRPAN
jgi:SAM-dependent methyltransferase